MNKNNGLGLFKSLAYSSGNLGTLLISQLMVMWLVFFYTAAEERTYAAVLLVGYAIFFGRVVDALADPIVGYFSDKFRSHLGRRIPFIAIGTPFLVISWILLFYPPVVDESIINVLYLAAVTGFFWIFFTIVVAPYLALLPEIVSSHRQRINLATYQAYFGILGLFIAFLGSGYLIEHFGFRIMAIVMGVITFLCFCAPVLFIRETPWSAVKEVDLSFTRAVTQCFRNKPFLYYVIGFSFFTMMGLSVVTAGVPFIVTVLMKAPVAWSGYALGIMLGVALLFFPLINYSAKRWGKRAVFVAILLLMSICFFLLATIGKLPLPPFYHGIFLIALAGIPISGILVLANPLLADIIDRDEAATGFRREAIYFGARGLIEKAAIGFSALSLTQMLHVFGKTIEKPLGITLIGVVAGIIVFIGLLIFFRFPLKK